MKHSCVFCSPHGQPRPSGLDRFREVLPELRERDGQPHSLAGEAHERRGAQSRSFYLSRLHAIPAETVRHAVIAVDVVGALPVLAAARVLIDLERHVARYVRVPDLRARLDGAVDRGLKVQRERRVPDQHRAGIAQVPEASLMLRGLGVGQRHQQTDRREAREEVDARREIERRAAFVQRHSAGQLHAGPQRALRLDRQMLDDRGTSDAVVGRHRQAALNWRRASCRLRAHDRKRFVSAELEPRGPGVDRDAVAVLRDRQRSHDARCGRIRRALDEALEHGAAPGIDLRVHQDPARRTVGPAIEHACLNRMAIGADGE
jgi:hypothetical protein